MVKRRLCVVVSPDIKGRGQLCTIVPLSTTPPKKVMKYYYQLQIPFQMPEKWKENPVWVKGDMVNAVGFHRFDLIRLDKDRQGKRNYQKSVLSQIDMQNIYECICQSLGLSYLT
ncbi:MAG: type II toxin-antitoxin system PemK/MazF family toxin [Alphaproteobacteria bacterium]|nr:type II toxin-antitoxin system PemK/MazF family toxin [Alphaproteobacteria bacterium]